MIKLKSNPLPSIRITSSYGKRTHPITNKPDFHRGIDLGKQYRNYPLKDPVLSVDDGTIIKQGYDKYRGNYIYIQHTGHISLYQHLHSYFTKLGYKVKAGQTIGLMGSTGDSTADHLHFEILINNQFVDPQPYLIKE